MIITLREEDGGTRVVLRHHGLPDDGQRAHHRCGWDAYLGRLVLVARGEDPARTRMAKATGRKPTGWSGSRPAQPVAGYFSNASTISGSSFVTPPCVQVSIVESV